MRCSSPQRPSNSISCTRPHTDHACMRIQLLALCVHTYVSCSRYVFSSPPYRLFSVAGICNKISFSRQQHRKKVPLFYTHETPFARRIDLKLQYRHVKRHTSDDTPQLPSTATQMCVSSSCMHVPTCAATPSFNKCLRFAWHRQMCGPHACARASLLRSSNVEQVVLQRG